MDIIFFLLIFFVSIFNSTQLILDGFSVAIEEAPYVVQLLSEEWFFCSGSIIEPRAVLTAAHCCDENDESFKIQVVYGSNQYKKGQYVDVERKIVHPRFQIGNPSNGYDIGILTLHSPIQVTEKRQPVRLRSPPVLPQSNVLILGFGKTEYTEYSKVLQGLKLPVLTDVECQKLVTSKHGRIWNPTLMCIGNKSLKGYDACEGDSGGPVIYHGEQIGIVSWGDHCGTGKPGIYTNLRPLLSWIRRNLASISNSDIYYQKK